MFLSSIFCCCFCLRPGLDLSVNISPPAADVSERCPGSFEGRYIIRMVQPLNFPLLIFDNKQTEKRVGKFAEETSGGIMKP